MAGGGTLPRYALFWSERPHKAHIPTWRVLDDQNYEKELDGDTLTEGIVRNYTMSPVHKMEGRKKDGAKSYEYELLSTLKLYKSSR